VSLTHYGVAQRAAADADGDLRFNIDAKDWLQWNGCRWMSLRDAQVQSIARTTINAIKADAADLPHVDMDKLEHADSDGFRRGVLGEMVATERLHVEQHDLDQHGHVLACGNGAIDLRTGSLVCERDLLVTIKNDTEFDPDAKAPLFTKLVREVFDGRAGDIEYYELIMGYTLQADPSERAMFFHMGEGTNGKSLLLGAIRKALGDYAAATNYKLIADGPGTTMNGSADGPSPSLRRLMSKRMAYIDEIPAGSNLRDADVRRLAGGAGALDARGLGKETVEFPITFVFHIACNNMATVRNGQPATFKRAFPVVYTKQFDAVEDSTLAEKLDAERAGILAWLVRCSTKYRAMRAAGKRLRDFMPQTAMDALENIRTEQNPFTQWIAANCTYEKGGFLPAQVGWENYMQYEHTVNRDCDKVAARSLKKFVQLMKSFQVGQHDPQGVERKAGFWGIRLANKPQ
jgi:putative DNA primase/helicase